MRLQPPSLSPFPLIQAQVYYRSTPSHVHALPTLLTCLHKGARLYLLRLLDDSLQASQGAGPGSMDPSSIEGLLTIPHYWSGAYWLCLFFGGQYGLF